MMDETSSTKTGGEIPETMDTDQPRSISLSQKPSGQSGRNGSDPAGWISRIMRVGRKNNISNRDDLADALSNDTSVTGGLSANERAMLHNILHLQDVRVEDVMVPRAEMEAVEISTTLGELLRIFEATGYSRMPIYAETLDDPRGMVLIRDVMAHISRKARVSKADAARMETPPEANLDLGKVALSKPLRSLKLIRKVLFVPASMLASDLMARMQANRTQMALVIDEYGGTDGLVSLEDIVEIIVGDIEDEHDTVDQPQIIDKGDGVYQIDARAELADIRKVVGDQFQAGELEEEVDTIGGLVFAVIGRIPARGEIIEALGFEFRVTDADPRRIKTIELVTGLRRKKSVPAKADANRSTSYTKGT